MPARVYVYRLGSLGDTVVALPCFHAIERAFPNTERVAITNVPVSHKAAPIESILRGGGFIDRSIAYPVGTRDPRELGRLARSLRAEGGGVLVYLAGARGLRAAWRDVAYFRICCGFKRMVGAPLSSDLQELRIDPDGDVERECERLARCLAPLAPIDLRDRASWDLRLTASERATAARALTPIGQQRFVAVNMGGKAEQNHWGSTRWTRLLEDLDVRMRGYALVLVGGPEDSAPSASIATGWSGEVLDLCGVLAPRETGAVLERASVFIGHDSGPLHLADSVGAPSVGIFGDLNPAKKWYPLGKRTVVLRDRRGVTHVAPESVRDAAVGVVDDSAVP